MSIMGLVIGGFVLAILVIIFTLGGGKDTSN